MRIIDQQPAKFKIHRTTAWRVLTRGFTMNKENRSAQDRGLWSIARVARLSSVIDVSRSVRDFVTGSSQLVRHGHYTGQPPALISIGLRRGDPTPEHYGASIAYSPRSVKHFTLHTCYWRGNGSDCDIEVGLPWCIAKNVFSLTYIQSGISHRHVFQLQFKLPFWPRVLVLIGR